MKMLAFLLLLALELAVCGCGTTLPPPNKTQPPGQLGSAITGGTVPASH